MSLPVAPQPPAASAPAETSSSSGSNLAGNPDGSSDGDEYITRLHAYVDKHQDTLSDPGGQRLNDAVVAIVIDRNGAVVHARVVETCGNRMIDNQILVELKQMSPFPKPPGILFGPTTQYISVTQLWFFH